MLRFSKGYRYGYQAQERDDEIYGRGASYYYRYRQQDARLGRFWSVDPLARKYPYYSPYSFSGNRLVDAVEWEGLEPKKPGEEYGEEVAEGIMPVEAPYEALRAKYGDLYVNEPRSFVWDKETREWLLLYELEPIEIVENREQGAGISGHASLAITYSGYKGGPILFEAEARIAEFRLPLSVMHSAALDKRYLMDVALFGGAYLDGRWKGGFDIGSSPEIEVEKGYGFGIGYTLKEYGHGVREEQYSAPLYQKRIIEAIIEGPGGEKVKVKRSLDQVRVGIGVKAGLFGAIEAEVGVSIVLSDETEVIPLK